MKKPLRRSALVLKVAAKRIKRKIVVVVQTEKDTLGDAVSIGGGPCDPIVFILFYLFPADLFTNVHRSSIPVQTLKAKATVLTVYGKERQRRRVQSAFTPHGWRAGVGKASRRGCRSEVVPPRQHWPCQCGARTTGWLRKSVRLQRRGEQTKGE